MLEIDNIESNNIKCEKLLGVKLLGVKLDSKLYFSEHITGTCGKANGKLIFKNSYVRNTIYEVAQKAYS